MSITRCGSPVSSASLTVSPTRADLRDREDDGRRRGPVGGGHVRRPVRHRHLLALRPGDDRRAGLPGLVLAHVREQPPAVDVADAVQPRAGRAPAASRRRRGTCPAPARRCRRRCRAVPARRPTATSTSSPRTSPSAAVRTTSVPSRRAAVTPTPSRTSTPASRSAAATASPAAGSRGGSSRSAISISVTCEPSACHAVAISQPTTPPPTMSSRPGTSLALVASRGVHGSISRRPSIGGTRRDGAGAHRDRVGGGQPGLGAVGRGDDDGASRRRAGRRRGPGRCRRPRPT